MIFLAYEEKFLYLCALNLYNAELCRNLRRNCRAAARQLKSVTTGVKIY